VRRRPSALAVLAAAVLLLTGCGIRSGAAVSESGWRTKVDQTLGSAVSSLATTELVLKKQASGDLTRNYVVVAVRDSQRTLVGEVQTFESKQPPASKVADNRKAMQALGQALTVLDDASNAASGGDRAARRRALREVHETSAMVQKLQDQLTGGGG
jgi:ABC-type phosphate transport system auxiliary subunit